MIEWRHPLGTLVRNQKPTNDWAYIEHDALNTSFVTWPVTSGRPSNATLGFEVAGRVVEAGVAVNNACYCEATDLRSHLRYILQMHASSLDSGTCSQHIGRPHFQQRRGNPNSSLYGLYCVVYSRIDFEKPLCTDLCCFPKYRSGGCVAVPVSQGLHCSASNSVQRVTLIRDLGSIGACLPETIICVMACSVD